MATPEQRQRMAAAIVNFEARRDKDGHLMIYHPPKGDGGGAFEVAGINARYNRKTAGTLVALIHQHRFDEAEQLATDFIARDTDSVASWTSVPAIEFYLRDCVFNRGATGGARILQRALGVAADGLIGGRTRAAEAAAERDPPALLAKLRAAREQYERDVAHRGETSPFWKGLVNRWDKALEVAKSFPTTRSRTPAATQPLRPLADDGSSSTPMPGRDPVAPAADGRSGADFPPRPSFPPLVSNGQREAVFGRYDYIRAPIPGDRDAIRIVGSWERDNIVDVPIPQLRRALGARAPHTIRFHRLGADQLQGLWMEWERENLLDRVLSYDGSFVARFVRGSRTVLSNHAFGTAFDLNEASNGLGLRPPLVGHKGSVRELVPIANRWGFYWGGHYKGRPDGMHFEVAVLKAKDETKQPLEPELAEVS
jgi:hypothetical protein